jgi:membrane-bound metal-dependent hydrolase YbcI (DUF457 family)
MLLDIGVGIIMALLMSKIFALSLAMPVGIMVIAGIVFSLLMDTDALINLFIHRGTGASYKHRDLFHLPLLYIPIGMLVLYFLQLYQYQLPALALPTLFALCSLAHFIHDSIGLGWGVKWLYPFSNNQYSFFYQYNTHKAELRPSKWGIYIWKSADIDRLEEKYGDTEWFRHIYMIWHPYSLVEAAVFLFALVLLYFNC